MADDKMYLIITIRREVADREQGRTIYDIVKLRLQDHPNVKITGQISNHFLDDPET